jgi:hypothetical protein
MRIVNRQPLNVELLTLDDGTQKIAWDIKQLQSLLGISDLLHQEELSSAANTGVNSSGIPTIETVIAILDELGLKDLYEVRYRKQYATIIPKTDSKRPKVAIYVVQQQTELALSIHERLWNGSLMQFWWRVDSGFIQHLILSDRFQTLYIPSSEKTEVITRLCETMGDKVANLSCFEKNFEYCSSLGFPCNLPYDNDASFWQELKNESKKENEFLKIPKKQPHPSIDYSAVINDMIEQNICYSLDLDQRFPATRRIQFNDYSTIKNFFLDLHKNIQEFLLSNGDKPTLIEIFENPIYSDDDF